jgi:hypothetical protein
MSARRMTRQAAGEERIAMASSALIIIDMLNP